MKKKPTLSAIKRTRNCRVKFKAIVIKVWSFQGILALPLRFYDHTRSLFITFCQYITAYDMHTIKKNLSSIVVKLCRKPIPIFSRCPFSKQDEFDFD